MSPGHAGPKGRAAGQLVGSWSVESGNQGGHVCFEGLSVDGADVSRSLEHGLLFGARDIEIAENRKMIGADTMLDYAGKKQSLFLSIENPVKYVSALVSWL